MYELHARTRRKRRLDRDRDIRNIAAAASQARSRKRTAEQKRGGRPPARQAGGGTDGVVAAAVCGKRLFCTLRHLSLSLSLLPFHRSRRFRSALARWLLLYPMWPHCTAPPPLPSRLPVSVPRSLIRSLPASALKR